MGHAAALQGAGSSRSAVESGGRRQSRHHGSMADTGVCATGTKETDLIHASLG